MSQETAEWLNTMTLIGFVKKRGEKAWHFDPVFQGEESNHYDFEIPVEDVRRRLLNWEAISAPIYVLSEDGKSRVKIPGRQAILRSDTRELLGLFKDSYVPHQYDEWLVRNVETILDDTLQIGSAGLLQNGARAWVSVEVGDNFEGAGGVDFRPQLIAATSFDGTLATTYKRSCTIVVCDNTLAMGLGGSGEQFKLRHTSGSLTKIAEAREALNLIYQQAEEFDEELKRLLNVEVSDEKFTEVLDIMVPLTDSRGLPLEVGRARTMAENKRDEITGLYRTSDMAAPWNGTAFGVLQAFNTYQHHSSIVRGQASRLQKNRSDALYGATEAKDAEVIRAISKALPAAALA